ncbi:redoxin family protein [Polaribacter pectinis]|uniref:Redoxin family protein n=1 Tax=Polaribacter pectinis TaxID=2738844 RepID=A0A7G9LE82_9FLAO|nr:TlpA disulfide reductase family protein [Polaribacter pectinis]QNM86931.1 redoxin family protein [Polaribacter pectinis]
MIKKSIFIAILFLGLFSCKKEEKVADFKKVTSVESYTYNELKPLLEKKDSKTYVINFWATWCGPCVKELPYFEKINEEYKNKNVEVILVSLDFPKHVEKKLIPYINTKKLQSKVVLLDDANEDFWIKDIDSTWSGAIPATIIYNKNKRKFYKKSFDFETLENELQTYLK